MLCYRCLLWSHIRLLPKSVSTAQVHSAFFPLCKALPLLLLAIRFVEADGMGF